MTPIEIAIVVPVFREAANVQLLVRQLHTALADRSWEVIFVDDDSDDGTADILRDLGQGDPHVRLLLRVRERGLSSAAVAGLLAAKGRYLVVMDGDGQHDPELITQLIAPLAAGEADIVSAARSFDSLDEASLPEGRRQLSKLANNTANWLTGRPNVDPMSGFFAIEAVTFVRVARRLGDAGFKLLLDILLSAPDLRHREIPFRFRGRLHGRSKLDMAAAWQFFTFVLYQLAGRSLPQPFISFVAIGTSGLLVHFAILYPLLTAGAGFAAAQTVAAAAATAWNFWFNNLLTFRDRRLAGVGLATGFLKYLAIASVGLIANVAVATRVEASLSGFFTLSALAGILMDTVWKFVLASVVVWRRA